MSLPGTAGLAPALAAAALAVPAGPAGADIDCRFETECLEGEVCADSGFELKLETALSPGTVLAEGGLPEGDRVVRHRGRGKRVGCRRPRARRLLGRTARLSHAVV